VTFFQYALSAVSHALASAIEAFGTALIICFLNASCTGADFSADGLVYLGNSNVVTDGNTQSSNAKCSKFVMNQFTTNGHVNLDFDQTVETCAAIGLKQWGGIIVHLTQ